MKIDSFLKKYTLPLLLILFFPLVFLSAYCQRPEPGYCTESIGVVKSVKTETLNKRIRLIVELDNGLVYVENRTGRGVRVGTHVYNECKLLFRNYRYES